MKRALIACICLTPLIAAFWFGYPVKNRQIVLKDGYALSRRCFKVGELGQFMSCYRQNNILKQGQLVSVIQQETSALSPFFDSIFFGAVAALIVILFFL